MDPEIHNRTHKHLTFYLSWDSSTQWSLSYRAYLRPVLTLFSIYAYVSQESHS